MILWRYGQERLVREAREQMLMTEGAVGSGVATVFNREYAKKRQRELQRANKPARKGVPNPDWAAQIAADFPGHAPRGDN